MSLKKDSAATHEDVDGAARKTIQEEDGLDAEVDVDAGAAGAAGGAGNEYDY